MRNGFDAASGGGWQWLAGLCLWVLAGDSASAMALGRPAGDPLLGRPLQMSVATALDEADGAGTTCVQAAWQQGSGKPMPLEWALEPAPQAGQWVIQLRSAEVVVEPMLTVTITMGCAQQFTRGYVLLAEPPREAGEPTRTAPARPEPLALDTATLPGPAFAAAPAVLKASVRLADPAAGLQVRPMPPAEEAPLMLPQPARTLPAPTAQPAAAPLPAGIPRLKVELFDTAVDQAPVLRLAMALATPPAVDDAQRAEASALWQAAQKTPEAAAALVQRAPARQAELEGLRGLQQRQDNAFEVLTTALATAMEQRDMLLAAAAVITVGLAGMAWLGLRARRPSGQPAMLAVARGGQARPAPPTGEADDALPRALAPSAREAPTGLGRAPVLADLRLGGAPVASAEELLNIQEKADFFVAVGRVDEAIGLLEAQLDEPLGGTPYVWLDLLDLCRRMEQPTDYERVRVRFQKQFSAHLPAFHEARPESGGLERYPRVLSRIQVLWPSSKVLGVIESALFDAPAPGAIPFDLEASRDLLLLYGLLLDLLNEAPRQPDFVATMEAPLRGRVLTTSTEPIPLSVLATLDEEEEHAEHAPGATGQDHELDLDFSIDVAPARSVGQAHV